MTSADSCGAQEVSGFSWFVERDGHRRDADATARACRPDREKARILARSSSAISVAASYEIDELESDLRSGLSGPAKRFARMDGQNFWKQ